MVRGLLEELFLGDAADSDLTAEALAMTIERASGRVLAKERGTVCGIEEYAWLFERHGIRVQPRKKDGDPIESGELIAEMEGEQGKLLACERVGLNLLQRMSGIATRTRGLQKIAQGRNPGTHVVATRKTPWGLLDKRAVHLGGGGTHRLGLGDAILVKNNHLALLAYSEPDAAAIAVRRIWMLRERAGFLEVEVRSRDSALAAARLFGELQERDGAACPCLLLLDNMPARKAAVVVAGLEAAGLLEYVLIEASGNISEENIAEYADAGVDAVSIGELTHSARALDICQRIQ
jgi:nicotinate-nucleotide pyrophosphorylase (carboxylating)